MKQAVALVALGGTEYETIAASTAQVMGTAGAVGDLLARVIVVVTTALTSTATIKDGAGAEVTIVPANTPVGTYVVDLGMRSVVGAWTITTGAGATAIAVGQFSF